MFCTEIDDYETCLSTSKGKRAAITYGYLMIFKKSTKDTFLTYLRSEGNLTNLVFILKDDKRINKLIITD